MIFTRYDNQNCAHHTWNVEDTSHAQEVVSLEHPVLSKAPTKEWCYETVRVATIPDDIRR